MGLTQSAYFRNDVTEVLARFEQETRRLRQGKGSGQAQLNAHALGRSSIEVQDIPTQTLPYQHEFWHVPGIMGTNLLHAD